MHIKELWRPSMSWHYGQSAVRRPHPAHEMLSTGSQNTAINVSGGMICSTNCGFLLRTDKKMLSWLNKHVQVSWRLLITTHCHNSYIRKLFQNKNKLNFFGPMKSHACFLGAFKKFLKATISFVTCLSVCPSAWNNSTPTGRISTKFDIWVF